MDNKVLVQALAFTENVHVNRLQAKLSDYNLEVIVKPKTFKPLRFCQVLAGSQEEKVLGTLDELLIEYEKSTHGETQGKARKDFKFNYDWYEFTGSFDDAYTQKLKIHSIGAYSWVIVDSTDELTGEGFGEV